jgi:hypothetical protein
MVTRPTVRIEIRFGAANSGAALDRELLSQRRF